MSFKLNHLEQDVKRKILEAARNIRKKYLALKLERSEEDEAIDRLLQPITKPLNKLVDEKSRLKRCKVESQQRHSQIKQEKALGAKMETEQYSIPKTSSQVKFLDTETVGEFKHSEDDDEDEAEEEDIFNSPVENFNEELNRTMRDNPEAYDAFIEAYPEITRGYLLKYWQKSPTIDTKVKFDDKLSKFHYGSEVLDFESNGDINIGGKIYPGTMGLYDLLFLKHPLYQTKEDTKNFTEIIDKTGVYYRKGTRHLKGSSSIKYKTYIRPLFRDDPPISRGQALTTRIRSKSATTSQELKKTGAALLEYNEKPKEYIYYNDVNELVDRLRKLEASKQAGNNNTQNEIINILRELERLGVIVFNK